VEPGCGPHAPVQVRDLATGDLIALCGVTTPAGLKCSRDPEGNLHAERQMRSAGEHGAELVFLTRFDRREAGGFGFNEARKVASRGAPPVITAVARGLVDNWLSFNAGVGTLLQARLWVLRNWWSELAPGVSEPGA
jgi:Protein of unknown function (DUF2478)